MNTVESVHLPKTLFYLDIRVMIFEIFHFYLYQIMSNCKKVFKSYAHKLSVVL